MKLNSVHKEFMTKTIPWAWAAGTIDVHLCGMIMRRFGWKPTVSTIRNVIMGWE